MFQFLEAAGIALDAIWSNKLRSFMTVLGNIVAVTSIIAVVSLVQGMNEYVTKAIVSDVGADNFTIQRMPIIRTQADEDRVRNNPRLTVTEAAAIRKFSDNIGSISAEVSGGATMSYRNETIDGAQVQGVSPEYINFATYDVEIGRLINPVEIASDRPVTIIGWDVADKLFGPIDPIDKTIAIGKGRFRIVGVHKKKGSAFGNSQDNFAIISLGNFQKMFGSRMFGMQLVVKPKSPEVVKAAMDDATVALRVQRRLRPKDPDNFGMFTSDTLLGIYETATKGIFAVLIGVVGLSLVVGGIVIMNIMLMVVSERTREIGLRKALGARRRDIVWQILTESVTLSTFGGIIGTFFGFVLATVISKASPLPASVQVWSVVAGIGVTAVVGLFFGMYPAIQAAKLDPIEALEGIMAGLRAGLLHEIVIMSIQTLRASKMRSALTVLGVVIGITSIVGMTSLIRGFDQSLRDSISQLGPNTLMVQKFGTLSFAAGKSFLEVARRPNLTIEDARAIERECPSVALVDVWLGAQGGNSRSRVYYKNEKTRQIGVLGATSNWSAVNFAKIEAGRVFTSSEVEHRTPVVILGNSPWQALFPNVDPIGKQVRIGAMPYTVIGVLGKRPAPGGFGGADDFVLIPYSAHEKQFGKVLKGSAKISATSFNPAVFRTAMIAVVPREGMRDQAMREVESILRIRHNLKLDQPNDFDMATQDAVLKVWDQISQATFLGLVVISSIALMVGGIGVMAIMMISVTERTREIGVRKALGARRREVLWQFLIEAAFLTSMGGVLGIIFGSGIGLGVHWLTGFPVSLPWWSFALGIGFSASVGIFFGLFPAFKASRLDPIEALRYE